MKAVSTIFLAACAVCAMADEKGFSVVVDRQEPPIAVMRKGIPGFAYEGPPVPGDEKALLRYRHAGAWAFRTASCDENMLKFAKAGDLRLVLLLDGEPRDIAKKLNLLANEDYRDLVAGVQLGEKIISEKDVPMWNSVVLQVQHRFPKVPIAMPAGKGIPPVARTMPGVSHLVFDLREATSPYDVLREAYSESMASKVACVRNLRFWAVTGSVIPGEPIEPNGDFRLALWNLHWMLTAFASEKFDAVIFDRPAEENSLGWMMRFAALAFRDHPRVLLHGEASGSKRSDGKAVSIGDLEIGLGLENEDVPDEGRVEIKEPPRACANFAARRDGDVEYLVLDNGGDDPSTARMCILVVNSGENPVKMSVEMKRGKSGNGDARRVFVDGKTGKVEHRGLGFYVKPGMPFVRRVAPRSFETLTFVLPSVM